MTKLDFKYQLVVLPADAVHSDDYQGGHSAGLH